MGLQNILTKTIGFMANCGKFKQNTFSKIISSIEWKFHNVYQMSEKYVGIKQGMMQELLTGKTRLV
ncbi:MAG TPA: hypothetical protein DD671_14140 [Balneolaceae bacterium]|nr:hypothetical protein [Balneolaceae bacterium]